MRKKNKMVAYCVCALCVHRRLSSVLQSGLEKKIIIRGSWEVLGTQRNRTWGGKKVRA